MDLKKLYKPNPEFKEKTKILFLSAVREKFGESESRPSFAFRYFIRGAASGVAFMLILSAVATYADQKNVGPESLLYPLKRTQEAVKVALTSQAEKPKLHLELAERRLSEIQEVRSKTPESPRVAELTRELKKEFESSFIVNQEKAVATAPVPTEVPIARVATTVTPLPEAAGLVAPTRPEPLSAESFEKDVEEDEVRKMEKATSLIETAERDSKEIVTCESWRSLLENQDDAVKQVLSESPNILERYNRRCQFINEALPFREVRLEFDD